jgi:hypothetical protein
VNVFFQRLFLGPLNFKFQSENYLDTTYLDKDMRISRSGFIFYRPLVRSLSCCVLFFRRFVR